MRTLLVFLLVLSCRWATAQGELNYTFTLMSDRGAPMSGVAIKFTNVQKGTSQSLTTDGSGTVTIKLTSEEGTSYTISYMDHENEISLTVPEDGIRTSSKRVTYRSLAELQAEKPESRENVNFTNASRPSTGSSIFVVKLMDNTKAPFTKEVTVKLVDVKGALKLSPFAIAPGAYKFHVEPNKMYEVDVAGAECLDKITTGPLGSEFSQSISFVQSDVKETVSRDTITQSNAATAMKSTDRLKFTINIKDFDGNPLADEWIYLKEINGNKVFAGKSDGTGKLVFQLPKTGEYVLNLKHESNLRKVDCRRSNKGFAEGSISFSNGGYQAYLEEKRREEEEKRQAAIRELEMAKIRADELKIAEQMRANKLKLIENRRKAYDPKYFKTEFRSTPIEIYKPVIKVDKTPNGYTVDPGMGNDVGTPLVVGNNVMAYSGFWSNVVYSFNAATGAVNWAIQLAEGGPSALVYQDGVLLVYTESCTLYAVDAIAGTLLWSKYLTSYVYSTPSVSGKNVMAVYSDGTGTVAACFDLRTGKINWQRGVLAECVGSPVIAGGKVYITTRAGDLDIMDLATGNGVSNLGIQATTSPTIIGTNMYVSHQSGNGKEMIGKYALGTYKLIKDMDVLDGLYDIQNSGEVKQNMTYTGSRVIGYKNMTYFFTSKNVKCLDPVKESLVWTQPLAVDNSLGSMQALAIDNMIAVGQRNGKVNFFDHLSGKQVMEVNLGMDLGSSPTIANNTIYAGSANGKLIVHRLPKAMQGTGTMWGGNAAHNLSF